MNCSRNSTTRWPRSISSSSRSANRVARLHKPSPRRRRHSSGSSRSRHAPHISILLRHPTKDVTENHAVADAAAVIGALLADHFANAHLFTTQQTVELRTNNKGEARLFRGKATLSTAPPPQHDRVRRYVLDPAKAPYLRELGIVGAEGKVRSAKADKYRQLQSIIKILDDLVRKSDLRDN